MPRPSGDKVYVGVQVQSVYPDYLSRHLCVWCSCRKGRSWCGGGQAPVGVRDKVRDRSGLRGYSGPWAEDLSWRF